MFFKNFHNSFFDKNKLFTKIVCKNLNSFSFLEKKKMKITNKEKKTVLFFLTIFVYFVRMKTFFFNFVHIWVFTFLRNVTYCMHIRICTWASTCYKCNTLIIDHLNNFDSGKC